MALQQPTRRDIQKAKPSVSIPDKLYFRIGEVARLCALPTYVLRFWESEFPQLKPHKGGTGQRLYRKRDVELVMEIKSLLYDQKFTIPGARRTLQEKRHSSEETQNELPFRGSPTQPMAKRLQKLRGELQEILGMLNGASAKRGKTLTPLVRTMQSSSKPATSTADATKEDTSPLLF